MKNIREMIWVVKAIRMKHTKGVPVCGGAICVSNSGLLLTTFTSITESKRPSDDLMTSKVTVRRFRGHFEEANVVHVSPPTGIVLIQISDVKDKEFSCFEWKNNISRSRLPVSTQVFAFLHTGGGFSFRSAVNNSLSRKFEDVRALIDFPTLSTDLSVFQVSDLGSFMYEGMCGCPVFEMVTGKLLGLILFVNEQFSLVISGNRIESVLQSFHSKKRKSEVQTTAETKRQKGGGEEDEGGSGGRGGGGRGGEKWDRGRGRGRGRGRIKST